MNIDLGKAVTYAFEDQQWVNKLIILLLVSFIPGLNVIVWSGYALTIARNIMQGEQFPLPNWENWSDIAVRGLLSIAAGFLYFLPIILLGCCLSVAQPLLSDRSSTGSLFVAVQCCASVIALIYGLAAGLLLMVGNVRFVQTDQFKSFTDIGRRIEDLRRTTNPFITLFVYQLIVSIIAGVASTILAITCVGPLVVAIVAFLANGYILGAAASTIRRT
ncbi:MAG: DUF4013 domain-containing protein [Anaerolineae bacterium]|nr:DUF4013 domain-containing protein [Anaerolineae bacterium]